MIRNLKVLLLAALAVTAVGALTASSASAHKTAEKFTNVTSASSTVVTTAIDGEAKSSTAHHVLDVPGNGSLTCNAADLKGTVAAILEPASITLEEEKANEVGFTECKFVGQTAKVKMNGCVFVFTPMNASIICPGGQEIEFSVGSAGFSCTVKVPGGQEFKEAVKFENLGAGNERHVTAEVLAKGVKGTVLGPLCLTETPAFTTGEYTTGNTLVTGFNDPNTGVRKPIQID
jgi:hypothetical protein